MHVTTYFLQMHTAPASPPRPLPDDVRLDHATAITPEFLRFLYAVVGGAWHWNDRLGWTRRQWADELATPGSEVRVLYRGGVPQGYVQLGCTTDAGGTDVEIRYFGLAGPAIGHGLGGLLLEHGVAAAWTVAERHDLPTVKLVTVHTCTLDGPAALTNYRNRGFTIVRTETTDEPIPDHPYGAWAASGGPADR